MQLSKRLSAVAEFVTPGGCLVDVGTDHGYVPIALLEQKKISSAIAMDVNRGPLERAREHIAQYQHGGLHRNKTFRRTPCPACGRG